MSPSPAESPCSSSRRGHGAPSNTLRGGHPDDVVVAVSHGFAIRSILCRFLGLPLAQFHALSVDLGSMNTVQTNSTSRRVVAINDRFHLDGDGPD